MSRVVPTSHEHGLQEALQALRDGHYDVAMVALGRATLSLQSGDEAARQRLSGVAKIVVAKALDRTVLH